MEPDILSYKLEVLLADIRNGALRVTSTLPFGYVKSVFIGLYGLVRSALGVKILELQRRNGVLSGMTRNTLYYRSDDHP